ncbi:MAG TPA: BspA family leucine-rich repeat surface protein [Fulvivirga sp.]|nr:BspA family leucine-rich repeat surface protein [Fulvivirga sp.]
MCQQIKFCLIVTALLFLAGNVNAIPFITTWQTDNYGSSDDNQITIPTTGTGYNYDIYWEEVGNPSNNGTEPTGQTGDYTITFPSIGTYRVEISGQFPRIYFNAGSYLSPKDSEKLLTVEQWGDIAWTSMNRAFAGCENLRINAVDAPDLSGVTDMSRMFFYAKSLNDNINHWVVNNVQNMSEMFRDATVFDQPLDTWEVTNVTDMSEMFYFARAFNQPINFNPGNGNNGGDAWNTSNVTNMASMFGAASEFNQDIGDWDVSNVTSMNGMFSIAVKFNQDISGWTLGNGTIISGMFSGATVFNQDISGWNTTGVTSMSGLFRNTEAFNQNINGWDFTSVINMSEMFSGAIAFTQDITGWDVSGVTNMRGMFSGNSTFNQDISGWVVDNVLDMENMFEDATSFNQDISGWNVTNVNDMSGMFDGATSFNQDLGRVGGWDVSGVSDMRSMFRNASSFDQDLSGWDVSNLSYAVFMFSNSGLSVGNYDKLLIGWAAQSLKSNVSFGAQGRFYCAGATARADIIANFNWFITDDGQSCINVFDGVDTTAPQIADAQVTPIDFGSIDVFPSTKNRSFTIENQQSIPITNVVISISGSAFSTSSAPVVIGASSTLTFNVVLSNATPGSFTETVSITSDDFSGAFQFDLTGEVTTIPEPEIKVFEGPSTTGNEILDGGFLGVGSDDRGNDVTYQFTITNNGSATLNISAMSLSGTVFSLGTATPLTIPVGNSETIDVTLDGTVAGDFFETLIITSDDSDESSFSFDVFGTINGPDILVVDGLDIFGDPEILNGQVASIDFGSSTAGSDVVRQLVITNVAQIPLSIADITISGSAFTFTTRTLPFGVAGEIDGIYDEVLFEITLSGATAGSFNETVTILCDDDADPIFEFQLTGQITAPEIEVYEGSTTSGTAITDGQLAAYDFGSDFQGSPITQQITIENTGMEILNISSISISGSAYSLVTTAPTSVGVGGAETVDIILSGATIGVFNETVTIINDDTDEGNFDFPITGEIMVIPEPEINVYNGPNNAGAVIADGQATAIDFGTDVQGNDITHQITIENTGTAALNISSISISGSAFSLTSTAPTTIGIGASETIAIDLSGAAVGVFTETISINSDDADESVFNFGLTGEITSVATPEIAVYDGANTSGTLIVDGQASPIDFGSATQGADITRPITIENIGSASLNISNITITGTAFTIASTPTSVAIGGTETFDIVLSAATVGVFNETIIIINDDTSEATFDFQLTGEITASPQPEIAVYAGNSTSGTAISNGQTSAVNIGTSEIGTAISQPITIENTGSLDLIITDITISGSAFALGSTLPNTISAGSSVTVDVILSGASAGTFSETLTITNNDPDEAVFSFPISGEITEAKVSLVVDGESRASGEDIVFEDALVGSSKIRELTITNSGNANLVITNITIDGDDFTLQSDVPGPLAPGESTVLLIQFSPTSLGPKSAVLTIQSVATADFTAVLMANGLSDIPPIEIINVVTVQQNGKHDFLELRNIEFYNTSTIFIYNRWGSQVFKTTDYNNTTNRFIGNSDKGDELPDGTYFYLIELNGGEIVKNGFFLLRR